MKKLIVLLLVIVTLTGILSACGDEKKDNNFGQSAAPSQSEESYVEPELPEGTIVERVETFEVDENVYGKEKR